MMRMRIEDLSGTVRRLAVDKTLDPASHGLARLSGGMNHDLFATIEETPLVVKAFRPGANEAAKREWDALVTLAGSGIAPEPIRFDPGTPSIVVMSHVTGSSLPATALGVDHAWRIGEAHKLVHRAEPPSSGPRSHLGIRAALASLAGRPSQPHDGQSPVEQQAGRAAKVWIESDDADELLRLAQPCFTQGDPNLTNYLWTDDALALIDWEYCGLSDPVLELANMAEHASTRTLDDRFWSALAEATELTNIDLARFVRCRKAMACFWLDLIGSRHRQGLPTTVTIEEQTQRTLAVLHL